MLLQSYQLNLLKVGSKIGVKLWSGGTFMGCIVDIYVHSFAIQLTEKYEKGSVYYPRLSKVVLNKNQIKNVITYDQTIEEKEHYSQK